MADGNRRGLTRGHLVEILRFLRDLYLRDDGADDKNALKYQMNLAIRDMRDVPHRISMAARNLPRGMCADDHAYPIEELISRILSGEDIDTVLGDNTICRITNDEHRTLEQHGYKKTRVVGGVVDWPRCYRECGIELCAE